MDFIDLVQSISQKFKLSSFKNTANSLLDLVSQYPGGVSENIVESHFVRYPVFAARIPDFTNTNT